MPGAGLGPEFSGNGLSARATMVYSWNPMLELQDHIAKAQGATAGRRRDLIQRATKEYFSVLDVVRSPAAADFQAAEVRARAVLQQDLLSAEGIAPLCGETRLQESDLALVALSFEAIAPALRIPGAPAMAEPKTLMLALAGAAGALGGMFALAPLMRLAFQMQDLGLVLGGPLGAMLAVLIAHRLARVRLLARILPGIFVRPRAWRGAVRSEHEKTVRACLEQWVDGAVPLLAILCLHQPETARAKTDRDQALRRIGKLIYALHRADPPSLGVVAHELIQEAKNSGFEDLEGLPAFLENAEARKEIVTWKPDLQGRYERFGHIGEGDQVMVERPAVVFGGQVVQRGLVRKVRERT